MSYVVVGMTVTVAVFTCALPVALPPFDRSLTLPLGSSVPSSTVSTDFRRASLSGDGHAAPARALRSSPSRPGSLPAVPLGAATLPGCPLLLLRLRLLVRLLRQLQQRLHLSCQLLLQLVRIPPAHRFVLARVPLHLRPIQAHPSQPQRAQLRRHLQYLLEQPLQLAQKPLPEIRYRVMVRMLVSGYVPKRSPSHTSLAPASGSKTLPWHSRRTTAPPS